MQDPFLGRVALITGASRGLGRSYANFLAGLGAHVVLNGRTEDCVSTAEDIVRNGGVATAIMGDIADADFCYRLIDKTVEIYKKIDILINNAGNLPNFSLELADMKNSDLNRILEVHLNATFNLSVAAWKYMEKSKFGRILNTSSAVILGAEGLNIAYNIPHSAAKAAIIGLTKSLAAEGAKCGIKVNAIMPMVIDPGRSGRPATEEKKALIAPVLEKLQIHNGDEAFRRLAASVAFLVHELVPCSGEVFSVCNGRMARVFFGETAGVRIYDIDIGQIFECFDRIMDPSEYYVIDGKRHAELAAGIELAELFKLA